MKVLVVEDEKNIAAYLKKGLEEVGYIVDVANDGEAAHYYININKYDLILLDRMIPGINGVTLCKRIRQEGNKSYIIMVTAKDSTDDKIEGLDAGADDYITKPFAFAELLARIRAIFRRESDEKENILRAKDLSLDLVTRDVVRDGKNIVLTAKEFSLLEYFLRNRNQVLTRTMISETVWHIDFLTDTNIIDVYVNHLRKKIDFTNDKLIHTVRGVGYQLKE